MGTEGVGDVLALQVPADRGWDQRTDSGRPPPGPNPPLAAGRCVPERPRMMNETWLWSGVGPDVETQTSGPGSSCGCPSSSRRRGDRWPAAGAATPPPSQSQGWSREGGGRPGGGRPGQGGHPRHFHHGSVSAGQMPHRKKETFNLPPSVLCHWGGLCLSLPGRKAVSGDEQRGASGQE